MMNEPSLTETRERLAALAEKLRNADHLEADAQGELADLVEELGSALNTAELPPDSLDHLHRTAHHLESTLERPESSDESSEGQRPLEQALVSFEAHSPTLAGTLRRLIDAISRAGI